MIGYIDVIVTLMNCDLLTLNSCQEFLRRWCPHNTIQCKFV